MLAEEKVWAASEVEFPELFSTNFQSIHSLTGEIW